MHTLLFLTEACEGSVLQGLQNWMSLWQGVQRPLHRERMEIPLVSFGHFWSNSRLVLLPSDACFYSNSELISKSEVKLWMTLWQFVFWDCRLLFHASWIGPICLFNDLRSWSILGTLEVDKQWGTGLGTIQGYCCTDPNLWFPSTNVGTGSIL